MQNPRLDEAQAGLKIVGRNVNKLRYADDTTIMAESEEELKSLLTPAMQETRVPSPDWEDPLEKRMAIHSTILAWRIPEMGEPGGLPSMGSHRVGHN